MADLKAKRSGRAITPEMAAALAAEAEAGYGLSLAQRRQVGRPSLDEGVSPRVSFRATTELYEATRKRAAAEGRPMSAVVREAVERYVLD
jgi:hypothetical protein